jgi:hypothetical protein
VRKLSSDGFDNKSQFKNYIELAAKKSKGTKGKKSKKRK